MSDKTDPFRDLLDRWEELRDAGQEPDIDELCRECPQLAERLRDWTRLLKMSDWLTQPADEAASETLGGADKLTAANYSPHQILGEYELVEDLGGGGMGRV